MNRPMRLVVLGLSLSSSWGNGHATTYRALLKAFARRGHQIVFLERDQPWYARSRDLTNPDYCDLRLYDDLEDLSSHSDAIKHADAVIVGSYVPEGVAVGRWVREQRRGVVAFYDIDTPVTLAKLARGDFEYLSPDLISQYDLYLSFTGGPALETLERHFGSPAARVLYCSVDTSLYRPLNIVPNFDLGYLGTYSDDRQPALEQLLIEPARRAPNRAFVVAGPLYPDNIEWPANVTRLDHVSPNDHAAFYASCRFTLSVTREDMKRAGHSPSVRLFEAAACGTPIISDRWTGLEDLFAPGKEIGLADSADDILRLLAIDDGKRRSIGAAARKRVLASHASDKRAEQLETYLRDAITQNSLIREPYAHKNVLNLDFVRGST